MKSFEIQLEMIHFTRELERKNSKLDNYIVVGFFCTSK